jgi:N-carbamoylputrescine amidase
VLNGDGVDRYEHLPSGQIKAILNSGKEVYGEKHMTFYGSSFISDASGVIREQLSRTETGIIYQNFDLDALEKMRYAWGVFRDRRPSMYGRILKK